MLKRTLIAAVAVFGFIMCAAPGFAATNFDLLCSKYQAGKCVQGPCASESLANTSPACQQAAEQRASGSNPVAGSGGVLQKASNLIAIMTGIIGVTMIIVGGFSYVTLGGAANAEKSKKARSMILSAVTGIIVVALAWSIVTFVVQRFIK